MNNSWRFRPIQPTTSAYPHPPQPPHQNPIYNPVKDPNLLSNQFQFQQHTSVPESDGSRKRIRVEDPQILPPSGIAHNDQWRLNMVREYGRHDTSFEERRGFENLGNLGLYPQNGTLSSYNNNNHYGSFKPPLENKTNPYDFKKFGQPYGNSNAYTDFGQPYSYFPRPVENRLKTFDGTKEVMDSTFSINAVFNGRENEYNGHPQTYCPPLPPNPPPPEPSPPPYYYDGPSVPLRRPSTSTNLFPITAQKAQSSYYLACTPPSIVNTQSMVHSNYYGDMGGHASNGFTKETPFLNQYTPSNVYSEGRAQAPPPGPVIKDKPICINACQLFKQPHKASRPDHFVIILRGLPGSGKSYMAKALRDLEVESGGNAPRIHSMDDYFMIEVEKKVEDNEGSKATASSKGKKQITKKVTEYCFEPEMEEVISSYAPFDF